MTSLAISSRRAQYYAQQARLAEVEDKILIAQATLDDLLIQQATVESHLRDLRDEAALHNITLDLP